MLNYLHFRQLFVTGRHVTVLLLKSRAGMFCEIFPLKIENILSPDCNSNRTTTAAAVKCVMPAT